MVGTSRGAITAVASAFELVEMLLWLQAVALKSEGEGGRRMKGARVDGTGDEGLGTF